MQGIKLASLFSCVLGITACTDEPSNELQLNFSKLTLEHRVHAVSAVMHGAFMAAWLAEGLSRRPRCTSMTEDPVTRDTTITLAGVGCDTGTETRYAGKITTVHDPKAGRATITFDNVQLLGEHGTDTMTLNGTLIRRATSTIVDLILTRTGITTHLELMYSDKPGYPLLSGSKVGMFGHVASLSGQLLGKVSLEGDDELNVDYAAACEPDAPLSAQCLWAPAPSTFKRGVIRRMTPSCSGGHGQIKVESASNLSLYITLLPGAYTAAAPTSFDAASGLYTFLIDDPMCYGVTAHRYSIRQPAEGTPLVQRHEFLSMPRTTWGAIL